MIGIAMKKNKLIMGDMTLMRILMIPCEMFCSTHMRSSRIIVLIGNSRVRLD